MFLNYHVWTLNLLLVPYFSALAAYYNRFWRGFSCAKKHSRVTPTWLSKGLNLQSKNAIWLALEAMPRNKLSLLLASAVTWRKPKQRGGLRGSPPWIKWISRVAKAARRTNVGSVSSSCSHLQLRYGLSWLFSISAHLHVYLVRPHYLQFHRCQVSVQSTSAFHSYLHGVFLPLGLPLRFTCVLLWTLTFCRTVSRLDHNIVSA